MASHLFAPKLWWHFATGVFDKRWFRVITRPDGQAPKVRLAHNAVPTLFKDVAGSEDDAMTEEEIFASVHASLGIDLTKV